MFYYCLLHPEISLPDDRRVSRLQARGGTRIHRPPPRRTGRFGRR
jgi:hypothetical protein